MPLDTAGGTGRTPGIRTIVVGIDGSDGAQKALAWAAAEAARSSIGLEVHAVYEPNYEFITHDEVQRTLDRQVAEAEDFVGKEFPDVVVTTRTHEDSPAKVLIQASDEADLLVVGSRGLGGFTGLLLGSVSQQCSLHARCPVVIVR